MTKLEMLMDRQSGPGRSFQNRPRCTACEYYDFNEMSDEGYCSEADYEPVKLYRKHRPNWCPRLNKAKDA